MIDRPRLEQLRRDVHSGDWALAGETYIELSLAARGSTDRFHVEAIAPYLRLRDAERLVAVIEELLGKSQPKE